MRDGKPDHEAAPHARYKMELASKVEDAIKADADKYTILLGQPEKKPEPVQQQISQAAVDNPFAQYSKPLVEQK